MLQQYNFAYNTGNAHGTTLTSEPLYLYIGTNYRGQVATVVGWTEGQTLGGQTEATCRPRKLGLPVLGAPECHKSTAAPDSLSSDKGCIGIIGVTSHICKVTRR